MNYALILTFIISFNLSAADTSLIVLGGGGEPDGNTTIFDSSLKKFKDYSTSRSFKEKTLSFNGGHTSTEEILRDSFQGSTNIPFTNESFEAQITKYKTAIGNGTYKAGDQLMIYIDTHGAVKGKIKGADGNFKDEVTHSIATSGGTLADYNNLRGSKTISMDSLKELTDLAETNNIKMAVIDMSCHSGNTLSLANKNTCVISSSGSNHFGYAGYNTFSENFVDGLKPGKNLEDVFLEAREKSSDPGFPMISTDEGKSIVDDLYEKISPYLYSYTSKADKLTDYISNSTDTALSCQRDQQLSALTTLIEDIEKIKNVPKKFLWMSFESKELDLTNLKTNLKEYKEAQDKLIANENYLKADEFNQEFTVASSDGSREELLKAREILSSNYTGKLAGLTEDMVKENDPVKKEALRKEIHFYSMARNKQEEIARANPRLVELITQNERIRHYSFDNARQIAIDEKKLFDNLYKERKKKNPEAKNPCSNFTL